MTSNLIKKVTTPSDDKPVYITETEEWTRYVMPLPEKNEVMEVFVFSATQERRMKRWDIDEFQEYEAKHWGDTKKDLEKWKETKERRARVASYYQNYVTVPDAEKWKKQKEDLKKISPEQIAKLREIPLSDITPQYKKNDIIKCLWHNEKTASLKLYSSSYHCFGCDVSGSAIDWFMKHHSVSFSQALREMKRKYLC